MEKFSNLIHDESPTFSICFKYFYLFQVFQSVSSISICFKYFYLFQVGTIWVLYDVKSGKGLKHDFLDNTLIIRCVKLHSLNDKRGR